MPVREGLVESLGKSSKIVGIPQVGLLGVKMRENDEIIIHMQTEENEMNKCKSRNSPFCTLLLQSAKVLTPELFDSSRF